MNDYKEKIEREIEDYFFQDFLFSLPEEKSHIISIAESILRTKNNISPKGGGFVQAVVDNDLSLAIQKADPICMKYLKFLIHIKNYNE